MKKQKFLVIGACVLLILITTIPAVDSISVKNNYKINLTNEKEASSTTSNKGSLTRPWSWKYWKTHKDVIGFGAAHAEADVDGNEGSIKVGAEMTWIGEANSWAYFYQGKKNWKSPTTGTYDISYKIYYRGAANGIEFLLGANSVSEVKLELKFGERTQWFTLYSRSDWPQLGETDKFTRTEVYTLDNVHLEKDQYYNIYAKIHAKSHVDIWDFYGSCEVWTQIWEGYLKEIVIPGGPHIELSGDGNFGTVEVGSSKTKEYKLKNTGEFTATGNVFLYGWIDEWDITQGGGDFEIDPNDEITIKVKYKPDDEYSDSIVLKATGWNDCNDDEIHLNGSPKSRPRDITNPILVKKLSKIPLILKFLLNY